MNRIALSLIALIEALQSGVVAADPAEDFVKALLPRVDEQHWWGLDEKKPSGGYLVRFEYDITGDGRREVFIASSLEADEESYSWTIYSPDAQQNYTRIGAGITIPPDPGFYLKASGTQRELQTVYKNLKFTIGIIDRYTVPTGGPITHAKQELTAEQITQLDADNWKESFAIGEEVKPTVSKVLLAEYANNRAVQWRPYKPDLGVLEQNTDPADAAAIANALGFTLKIAKQMLGVL
jgi:hypothetical protein